MSKYIYHFTKSETLIEHILPNCKLKLNTLNNLNDPKEQQISMFNSLKNVKYIDEHLDIKSKLHYLLDTEYKVCCFSGDYIIEGTEYEGFNLPRMWATYGNNHKGICIKIDYEKFCDENRVDNDISFLKKVEYKIELDHDLYKKEDSFVQDSYKVTHQLIKDNIGKLFFLKHIDWETEREIRFVTLNKDYCSIKDSIDSIIVGLDFNRKYLPAIYNQIDSRIDIYRINYDVYKWRLEAQKLKKK